MLTRSVLIAVVFEVMATSGYCADSGGLCAKTVAVLTQHLGDPKQTLSGQRVEVRQCPLSSDIGTMQLVAWNAGGSEPALVIDTELRSLGKLVMVPGAYAFEIVSASASEVVGIVFEKGQARLAVRDSTKGATVISSDQDSLRIELDDGSSRKRIYVLKGESSAR